MTEKTKTTAPNAEPVAQEPKEERKLQETVTEVAQEAGEIAARVGKALKAGFVAAHKDWDKSADQEK